MMPNHFPDFSWMLREGSRVRSGHGLFAVNFLFIGAVAAAILYSPLPMLLRSILVSLLVIVLLALLIWGPHLLRRLPPSESEQVTALSQQMYIRSVGEGPRPISGPTTIPPNTPSVPNSNRNDEQEGHR